MNNLSTHEQLRNQIYNMLSSVSPQYREYVHKHLNGIIGIIQLLERIRHHSSGDYKFYTDTEEEFTLIREFNEIIEKITNSEIRTRTYDDDGNFDGLVQIRFKHT